MILDHGLCKTFLPSFPCYLSLGAEKAVSWHAGMLSQTIHQQESNNQIEEEWLKRVNTPQKLPKPPTLSYFTSRYSGTQKPLYYGILIKTFWEGSAIWHGSTCPREYLNLAECSIRLWRSFWTFFFRLLQDIWIMQQIQNPTNLYPEYNPVEKLTKSHSW